MRTLIWLACAVLVGSVLWFVFQPWHDEVGDSNALIPDRTSGNSSDEALDEDRIAEVREAENDVGDRDAQNTDPLGESPAAGEVGGEGSVSEEARVWPVEPEVMKSVILGQLAQAPNQSLYSILSSECTPTDCEIRLLSGSLTALAGPSGAFANLLIDPPYDAISKLEVRRQATGANEVTLSFSANPPPPPTAEEVETQMRREADIARSFAANALPPASYGSPPVVFGNIDGAEQVVEDICSVDCPLDGQRVIYYNVPNGRSCTDLGGVERSFNVRSRAGAFSERTFCVPRFLIDF